MKIDREHIGTEHIVIHKHQCCIMMNAKCMTSTIRATVLPEFGEPRLSMAFSGPLHDVPSHYLLVAFIRHPINRAKSAWKFLLRDRIADSMKPFGVFQKGMPFDEYVKAISKISDSNANSHFASQVYRLIRNGEYLPDITVRMERLKEEWPKARDALKAKGLSFLPDTLPHWNRTKGDVSMDAYTLGLLRERYKTDIELWEAPDEFKRRFSGG